MNYTEKYHLPQWEKTDRVMMEDFNRMCQDMEAGILDAAAQGQAAADAAMDKAKAAYSPDNKPYVTGAYTGMAKDVDLNLEFRPKFIIISGQNAHTTSGGEESFILAGPNSCSTLLSFQENGVHIRHNTYYYPRLCTPSTIFYYVAFR